MSQKAIIEKLDSRLINGETVLIESMGWTSKSQFGPFSARMYRKDVDGSSKILFEYGNSKEEAFQNLRRQIDCLGLERAC